MEEVFQKFITGIQNTTALEFIAVIAGIASVFFSRIENILVYPVGLINTIIYIYISFVYHLPGEASVNVYYTIMSLYGWWLWTRKTASRGHVVHVSFSTPKQWRQQLAFFGLFYAGLFVAITLLKKWFADGAIPWADAFAAATAYTGMWLMARKKVESWLWWIATNIASIPLYFVKGLVFTSVQYIVLLVLAVSGLIEWSKRARLQHRQEL